jgi:sodium/potassium-transporting ATPase subunit alpha
VLIHQTALDAAFVTLRSAPTGLSQEQVAARRIEVGPNRIERIPGVPVLRRLIAQFTHFFAGLLWLAALLALVVDFTMPGQGMATLALAIVAVIVINGAFAFWQEYRAEETMTALQRLLPHQVRALRDGTVTVVPSEEIVPGDVIFMSAGDDIPADCRLIESFGVRVNAATLTGEATPVSRDTRSAGGSDLLQSRNVLLAGTSLTAGEAKALVFSTGIPSSNSRSTGGSSCAHASRRNRSSVS